MDGTARRGSPTTVEPHGSAVSPITRSRNYGFTFAGGGWGREIARKTDAEVFSSVLGSSARSTATPSPVAHGITRWGFDPLALGSHSYVAVGSSHDDHDAMAGPVDGVPHFAGEATWGREPATVHGALHSGRQSTVSRRGAAPLPGPPPPRGRPVPCPRRTGRAGARC
ncbi:hypothetical protein C3489_08550 [Streptomyces sp. Ru71]|uniref:FAD-dependent oxidoreductase n=1 Tax=Streptomyces sp. Ru71 TaxID=2080746 RepID=UPI000CDD8862|nr:hypothetical protein C3489_08550 [Streptomyces sp. Ru71]